jgi:hypothetical protein
LIVSIETIVFIVYNYKRNRNLLLKAGWGKYLAY